MQLELMFPRERARWLPSGQLVKWHCYHRNFSIPKLVWSRWLMPSLRLGKTPALSWKLLAATAAALHEYGIYVCVLNPLYIKQSGGGSIRKVKSDKADAMKIAKYGLDNWVNLREYTPMDTVRQQLKLYSRQYNLYIKTEVSLQNNLISLTDKTFPGANELFSSPERADGHQKWVDFVMTFWHCDCICRVSEKAFTERYQKWCKRKGYHFSVEKALDIYASSCGHFTTLPKNDNTKLLITTAAQQLLAGKTTLAVLRAEMVRLASQLPEYETVRAMYGVGETTAAQLMAEVGDVRRFPRRSSIVGFTGVDPAVNQSGKHSAKSVPTTKRGSPHLRKTLYQIVRAHLRTSPEAEPVYQFLFISAIDFCLHDSLT